MAKATGRRRTAPKRALIGPLLMLASGMGLGIAVWRFLMLDDPPSVHTAEQLSRQDREALYRLLADHR